MITGVASYGLGETRTSRPWTEHGGKGHRL